MLNRLWRAISLRRIQKRAMPSLLRLQRNLPLRRGVFCTDCCSDRGRIFIMLGTILIVVLLLLLLGAWPSWPHSSAWGYYPSGTIGLVLVIVLVLALMGRI
jgi:hypothetical protein